MEATLTIPSGIRTVKVVLASGKEIPQFETRKVSEFSPVDRVKSERGTIAFVRDGATIVVKTNAVRVPKAVEEAVHYGLKILAGMCNGAISWDNQGFSKTDTRTGKALASAERLTTAQVFLAAHLCRKYRRQLGGEILDLAESILAPRKEKSPRKRKEEAVTEKPEIKADSWYVLEKYDGRTATPMNGTITAEICAGPFATEEEAENEKQRRKQSLRWAGVSGTYYTVVDAEGLQRTKLGDDSFPLDRYEEPLEDDY